MNWIFPKTCTDQQGVHKKDDKPQIEFFFSGFFLCFLCSVQIFDLCNSLLHRTMSFLLLHWQSRNIPHQIQSNFQGTCKILINFFMLFGPKRICIFVNRPKYDLRMLAILGKNFLKTIVKICKNNLDTNLPHYKTICPIFLV